MMSPETKDKTVQHAKRFGGWWALAISPLIAVWLTAPQQLEVLNYKVLQLAVGVLLAYWADRVVFHTAPGIDWDMPRDVVSAARMLARAILAAGVLIAITVGI